MDKLKKLILFILRKYQILISPMYPPCCKFHPTCSRYTIEAIKEYGLTKGSILAIHRILKCNPISKGGLDYVPIKKPTKII